MMTTCFYRRAQAPWPSPEQEAPQHYPHQELPRHRSSVRSEIDRGLEIGVGAAAKADGCDVLVSKLPGTQSLTENLPRGAPCVDRRLQRQSCNDRGDRTCWRRICRRSLEAIVEKKAAAIQIQDEEKEVILFTLRLGLQAPN